MAPTGTELLIRRLETIAELSDHQRQVLRSLPINPRDYPAGADIVIEHERPTQSCIVLRGWVCRQKLLDAGRRQILSLHIPGEMPDFQSLYLGAMDYNLTAVVPATIAFASHADLRETMIRHPEVAEVLWRAALVDAAIFRGWIATLGARNAAERMSHLLCELYLRLEATGMAGGGSFEMRLTQQDLGDALGMTTVHVNRSLRLLREAGLVTVRRPEVTIENWDGLAALAGFDPTYLHLRPGR